MLRALELARKGKGRTSPNPCVGAVLVSKGRLIGEGYHRKAGSPHAEVEAVRDARKRGNSPAGATLYVTLEPCCTHGRTPPCTELILKEKIKRVVIAAQDPNPAHAGRGLKLLRKAGIRVESGLLEKEATDLNRDFNHWIVSGLPWVTVKIAMSLDGRITRPRGEGQWLTGVAARTVAHQMRAEADAIIIGAETARQDNPALTIRIPGWKGKQQPWRVVMTRSGKLSKRLTLLSDDYQDRTIVYKRRSWKAVLQDLGRRGVMNLLVEGGGKLCGSILESGFGNELAIFIAPHLSGTSKMSFDWSRGLLKSIALEKVEVESVGKDWLMKGSICGS